MHCWTVIASESETDGAKGYPVYGVQTVLADGTTWSWTDVDTDPTVVAQLANRLQATQPEVCHFRDIVLDFIEERAQLV